MGKGTSVGQLGSLVEMMVKIVGEDPTPDLSSITTADRANDAEPVFVLDERMCEVAGAINALDQFSRELLVLHHIEGIEIVALADAHAVSNDDIRKALAEAEGQLIELLHGLSSWSDEATPNVHALLVALAGCIDEDWANALGEYALRYAVAWNAGEL